MAPAPPSPDDMDGFWGPTTSTLDWCEENYVSSHYIAEYWNTVSNVFMIVLPIISSAFMWTEGVELRFILANFGLFVVGIGSWCFHMTLLYGMQLFDELPMIWGSVAMIYCSYESHAKPGRTNFGLLTFLIAYSSVVTVVYLTVINPLFHQVAYGLLVFLLVARCFHIFRNHGRDMDKFLYVYCTAMFLLAFLLWNIDNHYCHTIRASRKSLPFPVSASTQLHAWWHILAGTSTHCFVVLVCHFRSRYLQRKTHLEYVAGLVPFVRHASDSNEINHNL